MDEHARFDRRAFLGTAAIGLGGALAGVAGSPLIAGAAGPGAPTPSARNPADAFKLLKEGNARYAAGESRCGPLTARRFALEAGQSPFAIVLGCSDSRVPIDTVFDQVPGNIFVVRVAGNFLTDYGLGSIEYSIAVLKSSLLLVLGHSACGAVHATVKFLEDKIAQPGQIQKLVTAIEPAAEAVKGKPGDWVENAVTENVRQNAAAATVRSAIVADAVKAGTLQVVGGVYGLNSGTVNFLT